jgi:hypothetical protein
VFEKHELSIANVREQRLRRMAQAYSFASAIVSLPVVLLAIIEAPDPLSASPFGAGNFSAGFGLSQTTALVFYLSINTLFAAVPFGLAVVGLLLSRYLLIWSSVVGRFAFQAPAWPAGFAVTTLLVACAAVSFAVVMVFIDPNQKTLRYQNEMIAAGGASYLLFLASSTFFFMLQTLLFGTMFAVRRLALAFRTLADRGRPARV